MKLALTLLAQYDYEMLCIDRTFDHLFHLESTDQQHSSGGYPARRHEGLVRPLRQEEMTSRPRRVICVS